MIFRMLKRLVREEDGPTAVEYAVMLALIIGVMIASLSTFGSNAAGSFQDSSDRIDAAFGP